MMVKSTKAKETGDERAEPKKKGIVLRPKRPKSHYGYFRTTGFNDPAVDEGLIRPFHEIVPPENLLVEYDLPVPGRILLWEVRENPSQAKRKRGIHTRQKMEEWLLAIPEGSSLYFYSTSNIGCPDTRNLYDVLQFLHARRIKTFFINEDEDDGSALPENYNDLDLHAFEVAPDSIHMAWLRRIARNESELAGARTRAGVIRAISEDRSKKPGRPRSLTDEQAQRIIELTNKGIRQASVATMVGVSQPTVSRYLLETELTDSQMQHVNTLRAKNITPYDIARTLGATTAMIERFIANPKSKGRAPVYKRPKPQKADKRRTAKAFQSTDELGAAVKGRRQKTAAKVDARLAEEKSE
ncbi:helix-turn-helix domain-containing protein [Pseudorhizobium flavum]|uniref:helix-turn-helix domain-containing protein n=1 Tax=Pseudorhizobium flavum TaxID=1335061 RepID=UPI00376F487A